MVLNCKTLLQTVIFFGFLEFNNSTILDTKKWYNLLQNKENYDDKYEYIIYCLDTNIDMLDFDVCNKNTMKYYISISEGGLPLPEFNNKFYERLHSIYRC